jgi:hypothetical protein
VVFEALGLAQLAVWAAVVGLGVALLRRHFAGMDGVVLARELRSAGHEPAAALSRAGLPLALLARAAASADPDEALVLLSERALAAERFATRGLAWLRILGMVASALGFVAVAHQISWLRADHGLLDLDPVRVGRMASERAAIALALAVAASGTSVALGGAARARAREALRGIDAVRDLLERARQ